MGAKWSCGLQTETAVIASPIVSGHYIQSSYVQRVVGCILGASGHQTASASKPGLETGDGNRRLLTAHGLVRSGESPKSDFCAYYSVLPADS